MLVVLVSISAVVESRHDIVGDVLKLPSEVSSFFRPVSDDDDSVGTRWAVLIAGSNGYWNYRHQVFIVMRTVLAGHILVYIIIIYTKICLL